MRGINGTIYKLDENEYCYAQLNSLQGIGILPDGTIIVGDDRDKKTNDYYTQLLLLRSEYSILKRSNLTDSEFSYEYNKIHIESYLTAPEWEQIKKSNHINKLNKFKNEVKNGSPIDIKN